MLTHPGAENARKTQANNNPAEAALAETLARVESAWLANRSTAPDDDFAGTLIDGMTLTADAIGRILAGRSPAFLCALLTRGTDRLWTALPPVPAPAA